MRCEAPRRLPDDWFHTHTAEEIVMELFQAIRCGELATCQIDYVSLDESGSKKVWVCDYHRDQWHELNQMPLEACGKNFLNSRAPSA